MILPSPSALVRRGNPPGNPKDDPDNSYGYIPTEYVAIIFVVLFSLSTLVHLGQSIKSRLWFLLWSVVIAGVGEIIGWSGRLWSSLNVDNNTPFLIQISTTIISPTFFAIAIFIIFGRIIDQVGPQYSRMPARWYAIIFVTVDFFGIIIQAAGGGLASSESNTPGGNPKTGSNIMLAGIVLQMVEISLFMIVAADFFFNYSRRHAVRNVLPAGSSQQDMQRPVLGTSNSSDIEKVSKTNFFSRGRKEVAAPGQPRMTSKLRIMSVGLSFATLFLFIRAIYRTIELSAGWNSRIFETQVYFNVLDATMVVLAMITINVIHPMFFLTEA